MSNPNFTIINSSFEIQTLEIKAEQNDATYQNFFWDSKANSTYFEYKLTISKFDTSERIVTSISSLIDYPFIPLSELNNENKLRELDQCFEFSYPQLLEIIFDKYGKQFEFKRVNLRPSSFVRI